MDRYELMKKVFSLDSQRMEMENRVSNLNNEIQDTLNQMISLDTDNEGSISEETRLVLETFGIQIKDNLNIEKEQNMEKDYTSADSTEYSIKLVPINSPVRYDEHGNRLWFGKTPEQFTESDKMGFLVSNELELNGALSKETEKYLEDNGYKFYDQKLYKTPDEVVEIVDDFIKKQMSEVKEETLALDKLQPGDKLECYVPEYSEEGFSEISKMVRMEATIEKIGKNEMYFFSECSLPDYLSGASKTTLFSESQANVINRAIEAQVAPEFIRVMAHSELSAGQMDVICATAKDGFLVQQVYDHFSGQDEKFLQAPDMDMMRIGLQNGVEKKVIQGICSQELSWAEKRQLLNGEIKKTEEKVGLNFKKQGYPINRETARKVIQLNHCTHRKNKLEDIACAYKNQTFKDSNPQAQKLVNDISRECQTVAMVQHQCSV